MKWSSLQNNTKINRRRKKKREKGKNKTHSNEVSFYSDSLLNSIKQLLKQNEFELFLLCSVPSLLFNPTM